MGYKLTDRAKKSNKRGGMMKKIDITNLLSNLFNKEYLISVLLYIAIISGFFIYAHINGIVIVDDSKGAIIEDQVWTIAFFVFLLLLFIEIGRLVTKYSLRNFSDATAFAIRLLIIYITFTIGFHYSHFTQKIDNFKKEKQYYLRVIDLNEFQRKDGKGKLVGFGTMNKQGSYSCHIVYDESDSIDDHKGYGISRNKDGKTIKIPTKIQKIEPNFYYICSDYSQLQPKNKKNKAEK
ncbi:hypothetical protein KKA17_02400 [bacterium]|nr:hypothetical protein [bacterium]